MKVFVYKKSDSTKVAVHDYISMVQTYENLITLFTQTGETYQYDTKLVKTSIYQN